MATIMIVDDSAILRKTIKKYVEELGHNVVYEAQNGSEAVENYTLLQPDIVTMDISMPILNGIDALTKIISLDKDAKVIMITSHGEESLVMDAIDLGAYAYILKPITKEKLEIHLKKIIEEGNQI